jgi:hypothetical protein
MSRQLTRRSVLAALAGLAPISPSPEQLSPDAKLIALGREFERITGLMDGLIRNSGRGNSDDERTLCHLIEELEPIERETVRTSAKTIAGLYVKARAAKWSREGQINPEAEHCTDERMAWSIVRDLMLPGK